MTVKSIESPGRRGRPRAPGPRPGAQTLERGLCVLEALGERPGTLSDLSRRTGLHPSTLCRLLETLACRAFVHRDEVSGLYRVGATLGRIAAAESPLRELCRRVRPTLQALRDSFNETTNLTVREGRFVRYLDQVESSHPLRMFTELNARVPLHATGAGKALLFGLSTTAIRSILSGTELESFTKHTITDLESWISVLRRAERRGFALDREERQEGVRCIALPLRIPELPLAAISISFPVNRIRADQHTQLAQAILEAIRPLEYKRL